MDRLGSGSRHQNPSALRLHRRPHTSNRDLYLFVVAMLDLELNAHWLGKHTLFRFPFGGLMRWLGGIPVIRSAAHNQVCVAVRMFADNQDLLLCLAPEGTRKKVDRWKTGFYHIVAQAKVPIYMSATDIEARALRLPGVYMPMGSADREIPELQQYYCGLQGIRPENAFSIPELPDGPASLQLEICNNS